MKNVYTDSVYKYDVRIRANKMLYYIGLFETMVDAKKAIAKAQKKLQGKPIIRYIKYRFLLIF